MEKSKFLPHDYKSNIKLLREEKGYSVKKLLEILDENNQHVCERAYRTYENNQVMPPIALAVFLADHYDVTIDYLLGRSNCRKVDNEYIHQQLGLSDKAIDRLKRFNESDTDSFKNQLQAIKGNKQVLISKNFLIMPILNFLIESKYFSKFLERFFNYSLDWYSNPAIKEDDSFRFIQDNNLYFSCNAGNPADNIPLEMDNDFRKTVSKNMMILSLDKISEDYKKLFLSAMKK